MAKITPYQQGQMASSLVGTPGINLSGASVLNYAGNELGQIGAAQHQQYLTDLRQKQAEQRALQKHMEDMARKTQVTNIASGAQVEQQTLMNDLQMKYRNDPGQAIKEYNDTSMPKIQNTLSRVTDPETNMMLQEKLMQQHASNLEKLGNWQRERQVPIAEQNLKDSAGSLSLTTGQMGGKTPQEVKATIDQYVNNTHDQYEFYHPKGLSGQFEASSNAVKEYLEATASGGDPDLLEQRIKEFADGRYIAPSDLQSIAVQQRGIAAQVRLAQNTEATKKDQAAHLDTIRQLIEAGGGDMKSVDPAVAQQILNKNAPNLKPDNLATITQMISRNATEVQQREASDKALEMAVQDKRNKTGRLEDTPPDVIKEVLKIPHLSPEDREKYTKLLTGNVAAVKSLDIDKTVAAGVGRAAAGLDKLAAQIHTDLGALGKIRDKNKHALALQQLEIKLQRYSAAYADVSSSMSLIKDPDTGKLVELHTKAASSEFGTIIGVLQDEPHVVAAKKATDDLYDLISPKKQIYPDARMQQYYNYLHRQLFYDRLSRFNLNVDDMNGIQSDPAKLNALRNILSKDTLHWMNIRGLNK